MAEKRRMPRSIPQPGLDSSDSPTGSHRREYLAILFFALGVFLLLCFSSYDPRDPSFNVATSRPEVSNLCGLFGSHLADATAQLVGLSVFCIPLGLLIMSGRMFLTQSPGWGWTRSLVALLIIACTATLLERLGVSPLFNFPGEHPGGALGSGIHGMLFTFLGGSGEMVFLATAIVLSALHLWSVSLEGTMRRAKAVAVFGHHALGWLATRVKSVSAAREDNSVVAVPPRDRANGLWKPGESGPALESRAQASQYPGTTAADNTEQGASWERLSVLPREDWEGVDLEWCAPLTWQSRTQEPQSAPVRPEEVACAGNDVEEQELHSAIDEYVRERRRACKKSAGSPEASAKPVRADTRPIRVARRADEELMPAGKHVLAHPAEDDDYVLPSTDLLDPPPVSGRSVDEKLLARNASILEQKLADLGVQGEVVEIHPGPVITMYELTLAAGIPLRKVLTMADDLAMALKSGSTRVVAPIPGKDTVGIEVPNLHREVVYLREIIESPAFTESKAPLRMALGKGIGGEPFTTDLTRMPHLLIAGATGTGKSVGLNCLICSWLMSCHPDDLKLLLVDPKKLELSHYQDIPHLLHPVVTDPEKVPAVLAWAIREMERRYDLLSQASAKDIASYNAKVTSGEITSVSPGTAPEKLPFVVIIVDELAELMMVAAKDIEISIARLAQMARASGIHLILATQRPSVDVITGIIKANFPARLSFQVSAKADSRTILDTVGAEHLLGMGDMLFLPPGVAKLRRLHGAYISEKEIGRIVDFIRKQRAPVYLSEISRHLSTDGQKGPGTDPLEEEKYDEAVELVTHLGHASISLIQRHMRIGYNRAARIIEAMEAEGLIGPSDGTSRPREVLARSLHHIPDRAAP